MAYLVFISEKGDEIGRRRLDAPVTIGRAADCDVSLHDILLSRHHCRLEKTDEGWVVTDLGSRNGTLVHGQAVQRHVLREGESFRVGRVKVRFRSGTLSPGQEAPAPAVKPRRPSDPFNASAGTVAGFKYEPPPDEKHVRDVEQFPSPKPVMTDSGRFVGVTDEVWLNDAATEAVPRPAVPVAREDSSRPVARPKAPDGAAAAMAQPPGPPPKPPRLPFRQWWRPFLSRIGRRLRHPLGNKAALLAGGVATASSVLC